MVCTGNKVTILTNNLSVRIRIEHNCTLDDVCSLNDSSSSAHKKHERQNQMTNLIPQMAWFRPVSPYQNSGLHSGLNREIDSLFEELGSLTSTKSNISRPRISVWETDGSIEVEAELPGVDEKDIEVELTDDVLTIKGEKRVERDEAHKDAYYQERNFGKFARSITLPFEPDPKTVKTLFARGVLKVTLPKSAGVREHTVRIAVKAA